MDTLGCLLQCEPGVCWASMFSGLRARWFAVPEAVLQHCETEGLSYDCYVIRMAPWEKDRTCGHDLWPKSFLDLENKLPTYRCILVVAGWFLMVVISRHICEEHWWLPIWCSFQLRISPTLHATLHCSWLASKQEKQSGRFTKGGAQKEETHISPNGLMILEFPQCTHLNGTKRLQDIGCRLSSHDTAERVNPTACQDDGSSGEASGNGQVFFQLCETVPAKKHVWSQKSKTLSVYFFLNVV